MNFSKLFSRKQANKEEVYAGLFLKESHGAVLFIQVSSTGNYHILASKKFKYSNGWENVVEDIDQAIYSLETQTKQSPKKAIFFIYSHLIDKKAKEIKAPYLEKIKLLVKNLDFVPLGYIEYHEAVVEALGKKEETPLTAVLIEFDKTNLDIFVYRAGALIFEENIIRTENLIEDLIPVLEKARIQVVIPSRIILYNSSDLAIESGRIMTHAWKEDLFIQAPKVHVMHEHDLVASLIKIFIVQIFSDKAIIPEQKQHIDRIEEKKEVMGFVIGGDIPVEQVSKPAISHKKSSLALTSILGSLSQLKNNIHIPAILKKRYALILGGVFLLFGLLFISEFFFHTAEVKMYLPSQIVRKKIVIDDLNLKLSTQSANFEDTKNTTGKKDIGDYAKGSITIYNSSLSESKNFSKGTTITTSNNLKFSLDSDVKVASASGDASSVTSSTVKAAVTAKDIGSESNVSAGTKFNIGGEPASAVIAKNDSSFTGGSKRQVKTVSKQDQEELKKNLISKAKDYNSRAVVPKLDKGMSLLSNLTQINTNDIEFSHEIGEEASSITAKSTVEITNYIYKKVDIKNKVIEGLHTDRNSKLVLKPENIDFRITKVDRKGDSFDLALDATGKLTHNISDNEVKKKVVGKNTTTIEKVLSDDYNASKVEFFVKNPIPPLNHMLPFFKKNITLTISYL